MAGLWIAVAVAAAIALFYAHRIEPRRLLTRRDTLRVPRLPAAMDGFSIAFFSDLHIASKGDLDRLSQLVAHVNAEAPDLILIGGDISRDRSSFRAAAACLSRLRCPHGVYVARGNHDVDRGEGFYLQLRRAGLTPCRNEHFALSHKGAAFVLVALDDYQVADCRPADALAGLTPDDFAIAFAHEPKAIRQIVREGHRLRPALALTGHTHGGQVTLFGLYSPLATRPLPAFSSPWRDIGGIPTLYSNGVGQSMRLRFCAVPTLHFITLKSML